MQIEATDRWASPLSVSVWPFKTPESIAGGAGLMLMGPTSMR
jgi:hypothetical protein